VACYEEANTIYLVMDNLSSHNRKGLVDRFREKISGLLCGRFSVHHTSKQRQLVESGEDRRSACSSADTRGSNNN
jgi:hypothetical protein